MAKVVETVTTKLFNAQGQHVADQIDTYTALHATESPLDALALPANLETLP